MPREQGQKGEHGSHQKGESQKALLLKYNSMSLEELVDAQANLETDLSNGFFDILSQNSIDFAEIDGQRTMDQVINQYIADGKIDANDPLTAQWLENNVLSKNIERIVTTKRGEESKKLEKIPLSRITNKVDRIQSVLKSLGKLSKVDQSAVTESLLEIDHLIDSGNSVDAFNLSEKTLSELITKYKNTLEAQKDVCNSNYEYLKTKVSIYEKDGKTLPPELLNNLIALTKEARNEERLGNIREAITLTETMKDLVDAWTKSVDTQKKRKYVERQLQSVTENEFEKGKNDHQKIELQTVLSKIQSLLHKSNDLRASDLSGQFEDINELARSGEYDKAIQKAQQVLEYTSLTLSPKKDIRVKQNPLETPPTDEEVKSRTKTLEYGEFDENEFTRKGIETTLAKVQARLDFAHKNPDTLPPEEVSFLEQNIDLVKHSLEQNDLTEAFQRVDTLSHEAALLVPLQSDYDYEKNLFHKKVRKQLGPQIKTFETNNPGEMTDPNAFDGNFIRETKPATPKNTPREPILPVTEPLISLEPLLPETVKIPLEKPSDARETSREPEDLFEDFEVITIPPQPIDTLPPENIVSHSSQNTRPLSPMQSRPVEMSNTNIEYAGEKDIEADFFERGEKMNAKHEALAQEKHGFFSRFFDKLRPSQESPEDKLVRLLQKEKWLQNIPKMSHSDVLVSLKKFGVDLTGGAVDEQLRHVGPLLRSNTETGEVFKALWDKYLETQVHEKKKWEEAIPNMDIDHVYMNLEKFGINPDEDGRRDVKAKIVALRNEPGKRGEVFRMLFDRYIEIQNNNIRALRTSDKKQIIQFLKTEYKIDPTYYFEDTKNEKIIQQQKHIEEIRSEYSTRGKVIEAAMKRLEQLHEEKLRSTSK